MLAVTRKVIIVTYFVLMITTTFASLEIISILFSKYRGLQ